jgi:hypothetical protein
MGWDEVRWFGSRRSRDEAKMRMRIGLDWAERMGTAAVP